MVVFGVFGVLCTWHHVFILLLANFGVNFGYFGLFYIKSAFSVLFYVFFGVLSPFFVSLRFLFMQISSFSCVHIKSVILVYFYGKTSELWSFKRLNWSFYGILGKFGPERGRGRKCKYKTRTKDGKTGGFCAYLWTFGRSDGLTVGRSGRSGRSGVRDGLATSPASCAWLSNVLGCFSCLGFGGLSAGCS